MKQETWNETQIRQLLAENDFAYQNIELPFGLSTGGTDRSESARSIFPDDMSGKSVLDIGSKFGYFCFEALKRGATRVMGVDVSPDSVRKARLLAQCLGVDASFEVLDIEKHPIPDDFDYVLCLNVLHHLSDPIHTLDKLIESTREKLIVEVASLGRHDRSKIRLPIGARYFLNKSPVIVVNETRTSRKAGVQNFFITPSAIENLLVHQRKTFARVDIFPSDHRGGGRFIAVAHRRRIDHVVVIAGPSSSGKSTLIEKLRGGSEPELATALGIGDVTACRFVSANNVTKLDEPVVEKVLFHYDILRPHSSSAMVHDRDPALDLLASARKVSFITIWTPPEILLRQHRKSEIEANTTLGVFHGQKRHLKIHEEYKDPHRVVGHYRTWFKYTKSRPGEHVVVSFVNGVTVGSVDQWGEEVQRAYGEKSGAIQTGDE